MTVAQDELLKSVCHGLLLGCLLPVFAYNLGAGNRKNAAVYGGLMMFEVGQVMGHVKAMNQSQ